MPFGCLMYDILGILSLVCANAETNVTSIDKAKIVILATDGYERSELRFPFHEPRKRGAGMKIAPIETAQTGSW